MKFEVEILDSDLRDREIMIGMKNLVKNELDKLSGFSRNNLVNQISNLQGALEQLENKWLFWQRDRANNVLSNVLNIDRERLKEEVWDWDDDS